jgi:predicted transcriptional regulator
MRELRVAGMKVYEIADLMDVCASGVSRRTRLGAVAP